MALGTTQALHQNNVPVMAHKPGWELATKGADVEVVLHYDIECPDSRDSHAVWMDLLTQPSPIEGKTYKEFLSLKVNLFVLPYHIHSYQATMLIPFFEDLCASDSSKCYMDEYTQLSWSYLDTTLTETNVSEQQFEDTWTTTVADKFNLNKDDLMQVYSKNDTHNSDQRVRKMWKYSASSGVSGTPTAFVNGVMLDEFPASADEWK